MFSQHPGLLCFSLCHPSEGTGGGQVVEMGHNKADELGYQEDIPHCVMPQAAMKQRGEGFEMLAMFCFSLPVRGGEWFHTACFVSMYSFLFPLLLSLNNFYLDLKCFLPIHFAPPPFHWGGCL